MCVCVCVCVCVPACARARGGGGGGVGRGGLSRKGAREGQMTWHEGGVQKHLVKDGLPAPHELLWADLAAQVKVVHQDAAGI